MTISSNQPKLALFRIEQIVFPLPTLAEQHAIVSEIDRCFSVASEVEKVMDQSLKQAERLRQSILKKAFEGKLVPQDPNDPPASALLDRIRTEKEARQGGSEVQSKKRKRIPRRTSARRKVDTPTGR